MILCILVNSDNIRSICLLIFFYPSLGGAFCIVDLYLHLYKIWGSYEDKFIRLPLFINLQIHQIVDYLLKPLFGAVFKQLLLILFQKAGKEMIYAMQNESIITT